MEAKRIRYPIGVQTFRDRNCTRLGGDIQVCVLEQTATFREIAAVLHIPQLFRRGNGTVRGAGGWTAQEGVDTTPGVPL